MNPRVVLSCCLLGGLLSCRRLDTDPQKTEPLVVPSRVPGTRQQVAPDPVPLATPGAGEQTAHRTAQLTLASWNVEWLSRNLDTGPVRRNAQDYERLARYANLLDADVVALQEVDGLKAARRIFDPARYDFHFAVGGGAQRAGFAFKRNLRVDINPDLTALDVGGVRAGADLSVLTALGTVRLLSVHLKSGCFDAMLTSKSKACRKLARQVPVLEEWIDARAAQAQWFAVLGDFNRHFFARDGEPFWQEIDDAEPPDADLDSPTRGSTHSCWSEQPRSAVDHLVFGRRLFARIVPNSFTELRYAREDAPFRALLSDHCPLKVRIELE